MDKRLLRICMIFFALMAVVSCRVKDTSEAGTAGDDNSWLEEISIRELQQGYADERFTVQQVVAGYL